MVESVINYMDKFGPELLVIQFGVLVILFTMFLWLWFANRRKYHNLKHAIPANVVKSYLDSIIQNSTALKSQLFRGGGLDVGGAVPSVMPLQGLSGGGESIAVSGAPSTAMLEELNQKRALIASLESQLSSMLNSGKEVENKLNSSQSNLSAAEKKIKELEALLAKAKESAASGASAGGGGAGDDSLRAELEMIAKERDEIRDRLKEFEIIADDLANLKRLQQENDQLKKSLAAQGGAVPSAAAPEASSKEFDQNNILTQADVSDLLQDMGQSEEAGQSEDNGALEEFLSSDESTAADAQASESDEASEASDAGDEMAASAEESSEDKAKSDKTPEDLLSEFEKMLG